MRRKKSPRMSAKKVLDNLFSKYIRLSNADKDGYCICVTCGKRLHWKEIQAGHYVSRLHLATRWGITNVHCQCQQCNIFKKGNLDEYAIFIMKKYGVEELEKLNIAKHRVTKYHNYDLLNMIVYYKEELKKYEGNVEESPRQ